MIIDYIKPKNIKEAIKNKLKFGDNAIYIAGGTDLIPSLNENYENKKIILIDLTEIEELKAVEIIQDDCLHVPSCKSISDVAKSNIVKEKCPILQKAASKIGAPSIRNQATLGGNLINASPAADTVPAMIAIGAVGHIYGNQGVRTLKVEKISIDVNKTVLNHEEIVTKISMPIIKAKEGFCFLKNGLREALSISVANVAIWLRRSNNLKTIENIRIALGSVAPTVIRASDAERILKGQPLNSNNIENAAEIAAKMSRPISDIRATSNYRRAMVYELVKIAIKRSWEMSISNN